MTMVGVLAFAAGAVLVLVVVSSALRSVVLPRAASRIADYFGIEYDPDPRQGDPVSISRAAHDEACAALSAAGVPLEPDRDQPWLDLAGRRVDCHTPLIGLCALTMAPPAPRSSDRPGADWRGAVRSRRWGRRLGRRPRQAR